MTKKTLLPLLLGLGLALIALAPLGADSVDWPQYRGTERDGVVTGSGVFGDGEFGLEVAWKKPLGSGFSGIAIRGDRLVTMFTAGEIDVMAAFDADTGQELWRYSLGKKFPAIGGSHEGPLSTPTIDDGVVYGFGPWGRVVAVSLADGQEHWAIDLDEKAAKRPHFGFTTSPVIVGDAVVLQTGGPEGHSITAFDRASGEVRWTVGDATVNYQSPVAIEAGGREMVLAVNDQHCLGLDPKTGKAHFEVEHGLGESHTLPLPVADGQMLLNGMNEMAVYQLSMKDGDFNVEEVWRSEALRRSFALPVLHEGHVYGFNGNFMTAVNAESGETVWKSRPPGGRGLILVDGHLATVGKEGHLVVVKASPEGYQEVARVAALADDTYTAPSFAAGHFYARDLENLVAVRVTDEPVAEVASYPEFEGGFGEFIAGLAEAGDKEKKIDEYLADKTVPLVEDGGLVHFIYRGEVDDVAVAGLGLVPGEREVALTWVPGTTLFAGSAHLTDDEYRLYRFNVDFGTMTTDPHNAEKRQVGEDTFSVLQMPDFEMPDYVFEPTGAQGSLEKFEHGEREIQVYLPAGYRAGEGKYPLLVVHHGDRALERGAMDRVLDNLIAFDQIEPAVTVFLARKERGEYTRGDLDAYVEYLTGDLVPALHKRYRLTGDRAVMGALDGGFISVYAAMKKPDVFKRAATQSLAVGRQWRDRLRDEGLGGEGAKPALYVQWMEHDFRRDSDEFHQKWIERLEADGIAVEYERTSGVAEWYSWQLQLEPVLMALLPTE